MRTARIVLAIVIAGCASPGTGVGDFRNLLRDGGEPTAGDLVLTFFDVGLGDAILVEFPSGKTLLVDAGVGWCTGRILRYLEARGIRRLDGLLLTHADIDHYGGMAEVVRSVDVGTFYHNGVRRDRSGYRGLEAALDRRAVPRRILRRGDRLDEIAGPAASLEVLYPDEAALRTKGRQNRKTIVLRLVHDGRRILLAGDMERPEEIRLLALDPDRLPCDVVKLGHHASPGSGSEEFLRHLCPQAAIALGTSIANVPVAYPRPNRRIRRVLEEEGAPLYTTSREGTIQVISGASGLRIRSMVHGDLLAGGTMPAEAPIRTRRPASKACDSGGYPPAVEENGRG